MPSGPYVHRLDPILLDAGGVYLWWYGLSYTLGFLHLHLFLRRRRAALGLSLRDVYTLSILFAAGVLAGGRLVQVLFDEWPLYRDHPELVPAYWLGGMATHGLLLGGAAAAWLFAKRTGRPFLELADALVVPGAMLMGLGRIGNFIDGQIVGRLASPAAWWAVVFPHAEGPRHAVVLYDGTKNLLLVPYLLWVRRTNPTRGAVAARFVFWYAFPRIFLDFLREYPAHRFELGTGQTLNIAMAAVGLLLVYRSRLRRLGRLGTPMKTPAFQHRHWERATLGQRALFAAVLLFCLTIPSNWTQDIPARYAGRHAGLRHSWLYPPIDNAAVPRDP